MPARPSRTDRVWQWLFKFGFRPRQWVRRRLGLARGGAFVAIRDDQDVLVVRHSYRPGVDLLGGGLEPRETPLQAAVRELREETGAAVDPAAVTYLGVARRGFRGAQDRDHVLEWRVDRLPMLRVDNRELVWAGPLAESGAARKDLQIPVRWYLRRHAPDLARRLPPTAGWTRADDDRPSTPH